jgi:DnaK suppressor protein
MPGRHGNRCAGLQTLRGNLASLEAEELTAAQLQTLEAELRTLLQHLDGLLDGNDESTKPVELDQTRLGRVSRIDAIQQQKMAEAAKRDQRLRRAQVRAALEAIEADEYGFCKRCEEPIGARRLAAKPEAPFCVECQSRSER